MVEELVTLGAGPVGLSAAWKLSEAGKKVTILELEEQVGGGLEVSEKMVSYLNREVTIL